MVTWQRGYIMKNQIVLIENESLLSQVYGGVGILPSTNSQQGVIVLRAYYEAHNKKGALAILNFLDKLAPHLAEQWALKIDDRLGLHVILPL